MPKTVKRSLLDIAKLDLLTAKTMRGYVSEDEKIIDICAYHCQQCVEKVAKYMILLQGDDYANDHRADSYLAELHDGDIKRLIQSIHYDIDMWATTVRYRGTIYSGVKAVDSVIATCDEIIAAAEKAVEGIDIGNIL